MAVKYCPRSNYPLFGITEVVVVAKVVVDGEAVVVVLSAGTADVLLVIGEAVALFVLTAGTTVRVEELVGAIVDVAIRNLI